jgi:ribosome-binding protein aMBF1 (putative translation factor)
MKQQEQVAVGAFWDDLNRELKDPEVRRDFSANAARIQMIDHIVNALEERREAVGWSKEELAQAIGRRPRAISRLFGRRRRNLDIEKCLEIAAVLGMDVEVKVAQDRQLLSAGPKKHHVLKTAGHSQSC